MWLELEKLYIHLPDPRHLIQEDESFFEECVDFGELAGIGGRVQLAQMSGSESEVLRAISLEV